MFYAKEMFLIIKYILKNIVWVFALKFKRVLIINKNN